MVKLEFGKCANCQIDNELVSWLKGVSDVVDGRGKCGWNLKV